MDAINLKMQGSQCPFYELIEKLPPFQRENLVAKIETLVEKKQLYEKVNQLAESHDFSGNSEFFLSENFEYIAMGALKERVITPIMLGTLMQMRAALNDVKISDLKPFSLFDSNNQVSQLAKDLIKDTLNKTEYLHKELNESQLDHFFDLMRSQPPSEHYFVMVPDTREEKNISKEVNAAFFTIFCGSKNRMIPSLGMVKTLLDITSEEGFTLKLVVGPSTAESIRESVLNDNCREVSVHCPKIAPVPPTADGYPAPPIDFMYHDHYHAYIAGQIKKSHRLFFCELAAQIASTNWLNFGEIERCAVDSLSETLLDLEFSAYRQKGERDDDFWKKASYLAIKGIGGERQTHRGLFNRTVTVEERKKYDAAFKIVLDRIIEIYAVWRLSKTTLSVKLIVDFLNTLSPSLSTSLKNNFLYVDQLTHHDLPGQGGLYSAIEKFKFWEQRLKEFPFNDKRVQTLVAGHFLFRIPGVNHRAVLRLDPEFLQWILRELSSVQELMRQGVHFDEIVKMDRNLCKKLILCPDIVGPREKIGVQFNEFTTLTLEEQKIVCENFFSIISKMKKK